MDALINALRAAGEPSRLRLLALLRSGELTVSEITGIVRQSQPRVSRHLRVLCEAGLLDRTQEGTWGFYRIRDRGDGGRLAASLLAMLPEDDPTLTLDRERLAALRGDHAEAAHAYFRKAASRWDRERELYVAETDVEAAMLAAAGDANIDDLLDLGTGTGRVLEVFGERIRRGIGVDSSREMLAVARSKLSSVRLGHCQVRHGDIYQLELPAGSMDVVTIHHVLHFLDEPARAVAEAARCLRPGGRLLIVDFAPHQLEFLRAEHAHRRLGFSDAEVRAWCESAGLRDVSVEHLTVAGEFTEQTNLTVSLWRAVQNPGATAHYRLEVA